MGGLERLNEAGNMPEENSEPAVQATIPPIVEECLPEEAGTEWTAPVELPVVQTPEELAETAADETPPPDAPIG